jgi:hypothetical protein
MPNFPPVTAQNEQGRDRYGTAEHTFISHFNRNSTMSLTNYVLQRKWLVLLDRPITES